MSPSQKPAWRCSLPSSSQQARPSVVRARRIPGRRLTIWLLNLKCLEPISTDGDVPWWGRCAIGAGGGKTTFSLARLSWSSLIPLRIDLVIFWTETLGFLGRGGVLAETCPTTEGCRVLALSSNWKPQWSGSAESRLRSWSGSVPRTCSGLSQGHVATVCPSMPMTKRLQSPRASPFSVHAPTSPSPKPGVSSANSKVVPTTGLSVSWEGKRTDRFHVALACR